VLLRDTGSTNGTFVDGKRVTEITIDDGTEILIGSTSLIFKNS
jgi:adenylate cyclase